MSTFQELMRIGDKNTARNEGAVQAALEEKRRREETQRKAREQQERRELERQKAMRMKRLEDEKREAERKRRKIEEDEAREAARLRKEEEQRNSLLYGPRKAKPDSRVSKSLPRQRDDGGSDDDGLAAGSILTREELRQKKQEAAMRKMFSSPKRPTHSTGGGTRKAGKKLPGGAVDVIVRTDSPSASGSGNIRNRIINQDMGLIKLNTVKRDQRTIDEILTDVRSRKDKGPVLEGEAAKDFKDWFGDRKKRDFKPVPASTPPIASPDSSLGSAGERSSAPPAGSKKLAPNRTIAPVPTRAIPRSSMLPKVVDSRPSSVDRNVSSKASSRTHTPSAAAARPSASSAASSKKRRSATRSQSPPPRRRKLDEYEDVDDDEDDGEGYDRSMIWSLFGKDRKAYMDRDVYSDDSDVDDMEVDTSFMEQEEKRSARIARREDEEALLAEKRHEQEKARRRKERLAREKL